MDGSATDPSSASYWAELELVRRRNELEKIEQDKQRSKLLNEEVLAKRGRNLLVFHCGGSKYLKFGRASEERPFVFEHVCAYKSTARARKKKKVEQKEGGKGKRTLREVYVGENEDAFRALLEKEVASFRKGKLVASETVLENCWRDALEKAGFSSKCIREKMDVLLIASPLCSRKDIETMARTLLVGLNFRSICVHGESTCAYFSLGSKKQKVTCVVDIGAQKITAECVDSSGCPIPSSLVALPYGYEHMSLCNVAANRSCGTWMEKANGETSAYEWFENVLTFSRDTITCDNDVRYEDRVVRFKHSGKFYESSSCSKALLFASDALFEPDRIKFKGPFTGAGGIWDDDEVVVEEDENDGGGDDDDNNTERKGSLATSIGTFVLPSALSREEDSLVNKKILEKEEEKEKEKEKRRSDDGAKKKSMRKDRTDHEIVGLHEAIVASCLSCEVPMQKCEALQNILLVGGGAEIPEIEEVIEGRTASTLSFVVSSMEDEELATLLGAITPIVLDHRAGTVYSEATWTGGCILGCLDDSRGHKEWLSQNVFQNRLKVGDASKIESWVGGNGGYELNGLYRYNFSAY